jgi:hypothetical protein
VSRTFTYEVLGFGGTLAIISGMADHVALDPALAAAAAMSIALWVFLSGGVIDRLARGRSIGAAHFFGACGVFFWRFLRLAVMAGAAYWALFHWLHPFLFSKVYHHFTRDMTAERDGIVLRTALYIMFALALACVSVVADFAKTRAVVEDRRSMFGAMGAALRFIRFCACGCRWRHRRPPRTGSRSCSRNSICCSASGRNWRSWRRKLCSFRVSSRTPATRPRRQSSGQTHRLLKA